MVENLIPESIRSLGPYTLGLVSLLLTLVCAGFSIHRRWSDLGQSITSMYRSLERLNSDISKLPWVEGVITVSRVRSFPNRLKQNDPETTMYRPELAYDYSIDGNSFSGVGDTFHVVFVDPARAAEICTRYRPGTRVRIYFQRDEPGVSYLNIEEINQDLENSSMNFRIHINDAALLTAQ